MRALMLLAGVLISPPQAKAVPSVESQLSQKTYHCSSLPLSETAWEFEVSFHRYLRRHGGDALVARFDGKFSSAGNPERLVDGKGSVWAEVDFVDYKNQQFGVNISDLISTHSFHPGKPRNFRCRLNFARGLGNAAGELTYVVGSHREKKRYQRPVTCSAFAPASR